MDSRLTSHTSDELIEDALRTHPRASLPKSLTSDVMSQIRQTSAPRFRVMLIDVVITVVLTLALAGMWFGIQSLPMPVFIQLQIQGILLWQRMLVNARWLLPMSFFGLAALLALLAIPSLVQRTTDDTR